MKPEPESDVTAAGVVSWRLVAWLGPILLVIALVVGFELVYAGRVLPGVSADGVYLGGLDTTKASSAITAAATRYQGEVIRVAGPNVDTEFKLSSLKPTYAAASITTSAMSYGRRGSLLQRVHEQARSFFGRTTSYAAFTYNDADVVATAQQLVDDLSTPVSNAAFTSSNGALTINPSSSGQRVNTGRLVADLDDRLAAMSTETVTVPTYSVEASVDATALETLRPQAETYLATPITLSYLGTSQQITPDMLAGWLITTGKAPTTELIPTYTMPPKARLSLNQAAVAAYVSNMAAKVNQKAIDGQLTMGDDGTPTIAIPGQDGRTLDQSATVASITKAVAAGPHDRSIDVKVAVVKPAVSQDTIASLGIKDHLSQGISYFAGSDANRITNVRVGASKFNGVLIKPGATFSFNDILGDIGPQYGYAPGYVILGDHEEKQYGGGLCQVSSTAYRAALLAGFPITARTNHSFAVIWYTKPFGVPGVDATIYLPTPDFKFVNDSPGYLFIQTKLVGTTLTFDFYGTKTKSGQIRGPYFVSGSLDATKPSHTVFYRDILDLAGNVTHTDTVDTYYQSSLLYPTTN